MKWLTLPKIKAQLRIEPDFKDEDEWLEDAGETAEDAVLEVLNRSYDEICEVYGRVPAPVRHASLMLVASLYKDREKDLVQEVHANATFSFLLKPYMRLTSCMCND